MAKENFFNTMVDNWIEDRARKQREKAKRDLIQTGATLVGIATAAGTFLIWFYKHG